MSDIEDEVPAAVIIVADECGARRNFVDAANERSVDAVGRKPVKDHIAKGVATCRADEDAVRTDLRRLIDEDSRRPGRKRTTIDIGTPMPAILAFAYEFDKEFSGAAY